MLTNKNTLETNQFREYLADKDQSLRNDYFIRLAQGYDRLEQIEFVESRLMKDEIDLFCQTASAFEILRPISRDRIESAILSSRNLTIEQDDIVYDPKNFKHVSYVHLNKLEKFLIDRQQLEQELTFAFYIAADECQQSQLDSARRFYTVRNQIYQTKAWLFGEMQDSYPFENFMLFYFQTLNKKGKLMDSRQIYNYLARDCQQYGQQQLINMQNLDRQ